MVSLNSFIGPIQGMDHVLADHVSWAPKQDFAMLLMERQQNKSKYPPTVPMRVCMLPISSDPLFQTIEVNMLKMSWLGYSVTQFTY